MLVLATALVAAWSAPEASAQNPSAPAYVGLGDSLAVGVGASDQASTAYVPLFHSFLKEVIDPAIQLRNFAVRGETSTSMVNSGQLDAALAEIANRQGNATPSDDVRVITLDIGGNDLASVLQGPCVSGLTAGCAAALQTTLVTFSANLGNILSQLRAAAGPDARIIVMTYFNALANPGCPANALAAQGDIVLQGGPPLLTGLNPIIRELAAAYGAGVADVYGRVGPAETLPDCLHVNDSGYRTIAQQFTVGYGPSASATPNSPWGQASMQSSLRAQTVPSMSRLLLPQ